MFADVNADIFVMVDGDGTYDAPSVVFGYLAKYTSDVI